MSHDIGSLVTPETPMSGRYRARGFSTLCAANTASVVTHKFSDSVYVGLVAGTFRAIGGTTEQDYVDAEIVDLDNVLGLATGLPVGVPLTDPTAAPVLDHYLQSVYTGDKGDMRQFRPGTVGWIPPGIYLRVTYTSTGAGTTELLWDVEYFEQAEGWTP